MPRDEPPQPARVDAPRQVVSRRDGAEGAGIVDESDGVVDARRFRRLLAEAYHSLDRIMEPPRRPEPYRGIVSGDWRQLTRIGRLVEREKDERERGIIPVLAEQGAKVSRVLCGDGDVGPLVHAEPLEHEGVVIAERARVQLHDEPILDRHARHLEQHVCFELPLVVRRRFTLTRALEDPVGRLRREALGPGLDHRMIGGGRPHRLEEGAPFFQRSDEAAEIGDGGTGGPA